MDNVFVLSYIILYLCLILPDGHLDMESYSMPYLIWIQLVCLSTLFFQLLTWTARPLASQDSGRRFLFIASGGDVTRLSFASARFLAAGQIGYEDERWGSCWNKWVVRLLTRKSCLFEKQMFFVPKAVFHWCFFVSKYVLFAYLFEPTEVRTSLEALRASPGAKKIICCWRIARGMSCDAWMCRCASSPWWMGLGCGDVSKIFKISKYF